MGFKDSRFVKPSKEDKEKPTCHLYISGIGEELKTDPQSIRAFLLTFGELDQSCQGDLAIYMPEGKRYIFVTFKSLEAAVSCYTYLLERGSIPELQVSRVVARFATLASQQGPAEPECTSITEDVTVPGLKLISDFITEQEENELLAEFDEPCKWKQTLNRRVQQYGFPFNYRTLMIDYSKPTPPFPPSMIQLADKIYSSHSNDDKNFETINQLTINEYLPGQGIASHVDTEICFGSCLFLLSLGSGIVMTFNERERETEVNRRKCLYLPRRSLLIITSAARYEWLHGISPRKFDKVNGHLIRRDRRISFTFRHVIRPGAIPANRLNGGTIEKEHVVDVYDAIAVHWNHTRGKRKVHWLRVKEFIEALPAGTILADVGSGDGKYFGLNPGIISIGCDRSLQLLRVSKLENSEHETFCCDAVVLPLLSNTFDAVICIAVLHHLSTIERRYALICELLRIARYGGTIFVQAWALEQEADSKRIFETQDTMVPWKLNKRFLVSAPDATVQVNEARDEIIYERYCHVYREGELEDLCSRVPDCQIVESGYEKGNWFIKLLKVRDHRLAAEAIILNDEQRRKDFTVPTTVIRLASNETSKP